MSESPDTTQTRIRELQELVAYHHRRYHQDDAPEISDAAYDALVRELAALEAQHGAHSGLTEAVGSAPADAFAKVTHPVRQWSFDNLFTCEELTEWTERVTRMLREEDVADPQPTYVVEHKIDGLKLVLHYERGHLVRALTRGDGVTGEDVTHTARTISTVPATLRESVSLICVGEVWLSEAEFARINQVRADRGEALFANPRNAAAGSIRQLDPAVAAERKLSMYVYDIDQLEVHDTTVQPPVTQWEELQLLTQLGLPTNEYARCVDSVDAIQAFYDTWVEAHEGLPYGVDGIVIKVNEIPYQQMLGYTAKAPRFGIAYKFPAEQSTSVVENIVLQVGRTGVVTPVAEVRPTVIDGSTVARATLHNEDFITEKDVRIGDTVIIQKAGDIIPEIVAVLPELRPSTSTPFRFPRTVPECGGDGAIERIPGEAAYRCVSMDSDHIRRLQLYHVVSKSCFNIDGVGPKVIDALYERGMVRELTDIFTLTHEDVLQLPGFQTRSAANVVAAIEATREVSLPRFLFALSIPFVGAETARTLAQHFGSLNALAAASRDDLAAVYGIGATVAQSVYDWMRDAEHRAFLSRVQTQVAIIAQAPVRHDGAFAGKTVVLTGTLERFTRDEAKELVRQHGGTVSSSVSQKTDYVVVGKDPGQKAAQATRLGVPVLDETSFSQHVGRS